MGGLDPLYEPSPRLVFPPPKEGQHNGARNTKPSPLVAFGSKPPLEGVSGVIPPQDGPPNLGVARICWGVFLVAIVPILTDLYRLSWEIYS